MFEDNKPYLDTEIVTNVGTRGQSTPVDRVNKHEKVPEVYAKEPAPLSPKDIGLAQAYDHLYRILRDTVDT